MKKYLATLLSLMLMAAFACPLSAVNEQVPFDTFVVDSADILSNWEEDQLAARAEELTMQYDCAVYMITMESLDGMSPWRFNEEIHRVYNMGYGPEQSCIMLLLAMDYRDYDIMAHGYGNYAFTDYGKEIMSERFLDEFGNDDWYGGFEEYLDCCEDFLNRAAAGKPFDVGDNKNPLVGIAVCVGVPCLIALIVCSIFQGQMKTAKEQKYAANYVTGEGLRLTKRTDLYTHTTRTQRVIEQTKSSGGGTSVNSSGSSHRSGKF